ncbi:MAG: VOC family protein [Haloechinothrix sp.]
MAARQAADRGIHPVKLGNERLGSWFSMAEPKTAKNRMHIDINVGAAGRRAERHEVDAEVERLVGLGATVIRKHDAAWGPWSEYHYVMADREGNELCVQ